VFKEEAGLGRKECKRDRVKSAGNLVTTLNYLIGKDRQQVHRYEAWNMSVGGLPTLFSLSNYTPVATA